MPREINQVIEQLSKIEASSAEILSGAEEQKRAYAAEMEQKKKEFDNALSEQTEAKLKELRDTLNAEAEQNLQALRAETETQSKRLEEWYNANHTRLAEELFEQIVRS